ncbi:hypothetical protein Cni_G26536 [Canna indica]|uniref:Uncharacterized protein n=1 Tax=Canna indica TaxID=4628 RepID=A0AAQ3QQF5_9LILI|nr:hypothetical protein Cni_G26536 [Canna indica]
MFSLRAREVYYDIIGKGYFWKILSLRIVQLLLINIMGDSTAMTIEFLRARLLSERAVSKAAKERSDQLSKRVMELEEQLRIMTIQRRKAEHAAMEAISILETHGINDLSDASYYSSDNDEIHSGEKDCEETLREDEVCIDAKSDRIVVEDAQSSSEIEVSPSQAGSLSWKSHCSNPDSARKLKGKQFKQRQRRISLTSSVDSSPKYKLGKSCRKIKPKEMGSTSEHKGDDYVIIGDDQPELSINVSGSQSSFEVVQKKEADAIGSERDEEMERVLEQQAQLIGQYEAEEKAQREWEKKYNENKSSNPDCSEPGKQCHVAEVNDESQKDSFACFEKSPYEDEAKSDIGVISGMKKPECLYDDPALNTLDGADQGKLDGGKDANTMEFSNGLMPTDLPKTEIESRSQVCPDGLMGQVGPHVAVSDIEACLVEVALPAKVRTASSSLGKKNEGLIYENSDSGSGKNNNNIFARSHTTSPSIGSPSTANSRREILKWELSGTQDPSYTRPYQSADSSLGGVLEALQRAKISLKQELHMLPISSQGTNTSPAESTYHIRTTTSGESVKIPIGSAGLFRLPTDTFPLVQNSEQKLCGSGLSFAANYPRPGYAISAGTNLRSAIPYVEAGSKSSKGKFNFGDYHQGVDLPASIRYSLPYSGLTADRISLPNQTGEQIENKNFFARSQGMGIPSFRRYSLPSDMTTDTTPFPGRSGNSVQQYFDSFHPGTEEPPPSRYSLPYSNLTRERIPPRDGIPKPQTDARTRMPPQDQYSLYGGNGSRSNMQIL